MDEVGKSYALPLGRRGHHALVPPDGAYPGYIDLQVLGILASIACIIVSLFKEKWQMLINTVMVNALIVLHMELRGKAL